MTLEGEQCQSAPDPVTGMKSLDLKKMWAQFDVEGTGKRNRFRASRQGYDGIGLGLRVELQRVTSRVTKAYSNHTLTLRNCAQRTVPKGRSY